MAEFKWMAPLLGLLGCTEPKSGLCRITVQSDMLPAIQHFYSNQEVSKEVCEESWPEQVKTYCEKNRKDIVPADTVSITMDWKGERWIGSHVVHQGAKKDKCPE
jgi:hypothetical protein